MSLIGQSTLCTHIAVLCVQRCELDEEGGLVDVGGSFSFSQAIAD